MRSALGTMIIAFLDVAVWYMYYIVTGSELLWECLVSFVVIVLAGFIYSLVKIRKHKTKR